MRLWYFFVLCKLIFQTRMRSHPVWQDVWFLVRPSSTSILNVCADSTEPLIVSYVISTIISWAGSIIISDEFKDLVHHTTLNERIPFNFDSDFIKLHFGEDRLRRISYTEFSQLIHVSSVKIHDIWKPEKLLTFIWALSRENLSSGFATR